MGWRRRGSIDGRVEGDREQMKSGVRRKGHNERRQEWWKQVAARWK